MSEDEAKRWDLKGVGWGGGGVTREWRVELIYAEREVHRSGETDILKKVSGRQDRVRDEGQGCIRTEKQGYMWGIQRVGS